MTLLFAAFLALVGVQDVPQTGESAIEGVVTRAGTTQPIENVRVAIWGDKGPDFETRTDAGGHFSISNMPAGVFNIEVQAEGYLTLPNQKSSARIRLKVGEKQRLAHDVSLVPASSVYGRILDDNREPLAGINVELVTLSHNLRGRAEWQPIDSQETNEKGEYRFEGIPPDDYYVRASRKSSQTMTYYPGTLDARTAASLSLRDGGDKSAEFPLASTQTYTFSGMIKTADGGPLDKVMLFVVPQDPKIPIDALVTAGVSIAENFELKGLLPGTYDVFAISFASHKWIPTFEVSQADGASQTRIVSSDYINIPMRVGKGFVEIRDRDVRDVQVLMETGGDVSGRVRIAGDEGRPVQLNARDVSTGAVSLQLRLGLQRRNDIVAGIANAALIQAGGGSFKFSDVAPGLYDVLAIPQDSSSKNMYLADVRVSGRTVLDEGLEVTRSPVDSVEILIGFDGGGVEGRVRSTKKSPVFVVLAPQASRRQNPALFKTTVLEDDSERFEFSAVAPGLYKLFAFEIGSKDEVIPYLSSDFLALHENQGTAVTIEKGAVVSPAPLSLIPKERY